MAGLVGWDAKIQSGEDESHMCPLKPDLHPFWHFVALESMSCHLFKSSDTDMDSFTLQVYALPDAAGYILDI